MKGFFGIIFTYLFVKFGDKLLDRLFDYFIDKYTMPWIIRMHQAYKKNLFEIQLLIALVATSVALKSGMLSEQKERQVVLLQLGVVAVIALLLLTDRIKTDKKRLIIN